MAVDVAQFTRKQSCPAGCTQGVGAKHVLKNGTFLANSVNIGRLDVGATVGTDGIEGVIVGEDDQYIGLGRCFFHQLWLHPGCIAQKEKQGKPGKVGCKGVFLEHKLVFNASDLPLAPGYP